MCVYVDNDLKRHSIICVFFAVSVASPMVPGGIRNIHDNKVPGQISSNSSNHNARHCSNDEYMNIVHRLGSEVST